MPNAAGIADPGDAVIVDGTSGSIYIRPSHEIQSAYAERVRFRARRQEQYRELRDKPCVTKDGQPVDLMINAGLVIDLPHIDEKVLQEYNWSFRLGAGMEFMISSSLSLDLFAHYRLVIGDLYPTMQPHIELEGVSGFQSLNAGLGLRYYF